MIKVAIFVEGQTELITVREFLLREFDYNVIIECRKLLKGSDFKTDYDFPNPNARFKFQIINVGGDNAVLNRILKREQYMWNSGYDKIIGLRDMYSRAYREEARRIDNNVTQEFIKGANDTLKNMAKFPDKIVMCFAIMEIEAWLLAVYKIFEKLDSRLTVEYIKKHINVDLENIDPETEFFHPANQIEAIYQLAGKTYDKRKDDIEAIASHITKEDYESLLESNKCNSFNFFYSKVIP